MDELKRRHPGVTHFVILFQFYTYVIDNCRDRIIGHRTWTAFIEIFLDQNGNVDMTRSGGEVFPD